MRTGRKLLSLLLAAVLCLSLLPLPILAEDLTIPPADTAETAADGTFGAVFPDAIFRDYVWDTVLSTSQDDKNYDSVITDAQWAAIHSWTGVAVGERDIASLAGIEHFTAMTTLYCSQNSLSTLDLSANTALQELYCDQNQLTELDLSHNVALQKLSCNRNQLTSLTVAPLAKLTLLDCGDNQLTALDVSGSTALVHLYLANNRLTALDVTQNAALKWLVCTGNPISELDLRNNPALLHLNCINCSLTELDLGANTALTTLYCDSNQLTALDVSANTALENLSCPSNQIKSLDLSTNTALTLLDCCYNQLVRLDLDANTALTSVSPYDQMPQTDIAITQTGDDYTVSLKDILGADTDLSRVTVQNNGTLDTETGIVTFPYMTAYVRYTYNTHSPDNTWMRVVLQLNHEHEMHAVNLRDATCTVYGVTQEHWECSLYNGCFPDQEGTTRLVWESVHSYPTGHDLSDWTVITATTDTTPGRMEQTCSRCKNTYVHLLPPTAATFQDIFPDDAFRAYVRDTVLKDSAVADTSILTEDQWTRIRNCFDVQVSSQGIASLEGLQYFWNLSFLNCADNQLTELPLLENPELDVLFCGINQLTSLNVSRLPGLRLLYCYENQLASLDLSANPVLESLACENNALAELDVSKNPALDSLSCNSNALTELDVSKNPQLTYLNCEDNHLTKLDLSANTVLERIFCGNNLLRSLDVASDSLLFLGCTPQGLIRTDKTPVQQANGSYAFDLKEVLNGGDPHRVTMLDDGTLDPETGIVTYPEDAFPYQIIYSYSTGEWEAMDVFLLIPHQHALTKIPVYAATCTESGCSTEHWECSLCDQCFLDEAGEQLVHWSDVHAIRMGHDRQSETILIQPTENAAGRAETTCSHCGQVFPRVLPPTNATFAAVFPDDAFRSYVTDSVLILSREGTEDTDVITDAQWETIRRCQFLSVADLGIRSLAGVEYFEDLQWLYCNGNQLTTLDLRDNAILESVYCYDNQLTELNVTALSFLRSVSCANNQLSALDLRYNYSLTELYCERNQLTRLDVSGCPSLTALYCNDNQLTELDLSGRAVLRSLKFSGNPLVTLNASGCRKLLTLECPNGKLKSLILTDCDHLAILNCDGNQLTTLDLSGCSALDTLNCGQNQLRSLDLSSCVKLRSLYCEENQFLTLDLSQNTLLTALVCQPQSVSGQLPLAQGADGSFRYDLKALLGEDTDLSRVTMEDGGTLDRTTGIVTYSQQPAEICYRCSIPGRDDMDVTVTALVTQAEIRNDAISLTVAEQVPQVYFAAYTENGQIVGIYDAIWAGDRYVIQAPENAASYRWKAFFADGSFVPETWAYEFSFQ